MLERVFLGFTAAAFVLYGALCLFRPETLSDAAGIGIGDAVADVEIRAMYGGLEIAVGLLALAGLVRRELAPAALLALLFVFAGLALGRGFGMLLESEHGAYNRVAFAFEIVSAGIAGYLVNSGTSAKVRR